MAEKRVIGITTGDLDGIGLEVTMKAMPFFLESKSTFIILRGPQAGPHCWPKLESGLHLQVPDLDTALGEAKRPNSTVKFIEVVSKESPALWVQSVAQLCLTQHLDGMVTGPVSKKTFLDAKLGSIGHTPLLQKICGVPAAYMGFLGRHFNVALLTGHIPLTAVESALCEDKVAYALNIMDAWRARLPAPTNSKPLGVLGLNPHCGETGLIGRFEMDQLVQQLEGHASIEGPLVPDSAFARENWNRFSLFVALYHDQGLIPFKMVHGHDGGAHVTIGLPIVRTSVDHGTATEIFGKGLARPESMVDALKWCEKLIGKEN
jgi:4-hydroxythreonine-4-phosphate dehydrogenase